MMMMVIAMVVMDLVGVGGNDDVNDNQCFFINVVSESQKQRTEQEFRRQKANIAPQRKFVSNSQMWLKSEDITLQCHHKDERHQYYITITSID